jgi:hypothetical protein
MLRNELHETLLAPYASSIELLELDESKASPSVATNSTALVAIKPLHYLNVFKKESELQDLEKEYQRDRYQLDAAIQEYSGWFWFERVQNWLACGSGLLIISFIITTSNEAFINVVKTTTGADLPESVSNSISIPIAVISTGLFFVAFSCKKEAVKTLLAYAYRKPFYQRAYEELQVARQTPNFFALKLGKNLTNQSIMLITNATASLPLVINFADGMSKWSEPFNILAPASIIYLGERFFDKYLNASYMKGLDFFTKLRSGERKHDGVTRSFQCALQVLCSTALRVYPYYYWLALRADNAFGWWPPGTLVAATAIVHSIALFYPAAFNHYFTDQEAVEKLLKEKFPDLTGAQLDLQINAEKARLHQEMLAKFGRMFLLKKDKILGLVLAYDAYVGGFMGYELGLMANDDTMILPVLSSILLAGLFSGTLYQAEAQRMSHKLYRAKLEEKPDQPQVVATVNEKLSGFTGTSINFSTSVSIVTSIISTGASLTDNGFLRSSIYLGAGKRGLNIFFLNRPKIADTMQAFTPPGNVFKSAWMWFFKKETRVVLEQKQEMLNERVDQYLAKI